MVCSYTVRVVCYHKNRKMREIALDTETTGLSHALGDKITEIGCVEIIDKKITGNTFHVYINPEREVSQKAAEISGLTYDFLKKFKTFKDIHGDFRDFIRDDRLVIHNASFDIGFLNAEVKSIGFSDISRNNVIDTLVLAKQKYPGAQATLDALCRRFSIDNSSRTKHGALIDAKLLAEVYINMSVELFQKDIFSTENAEENDIMDQIEDRLFIKSREFLLNEEEKQKHLEFLKKIKNPLWDVKE